MINKIYNPGPSLEIIKGLIQGDTMLRAAFNRSADRIEISGQVLDLGGKSKNASYYIKRNVNQEHITITDIKPAPGVIAVNVENEFPLPDSKYDIVLAFHLYEHVWNFQSSAKEIERVLKPGGKFIVSIPFMYPYHADPHDYWRFTDQAAIKIWETENLKATSIECIGEGVFTTMYSYLAGSIKRPKWLRSLLQASGYLFTSIIDALIFKSQSSKARKICDVYALEWIVIYTKNK